MLSLHKHILSLLHIVPIYTHIVTIHILSLYTHIVPIYTYCPYRLRRLQYSGLPSRELSLVTTLHAATLRPLGTVTVLDTVEDASNLTSKTGAAGPTGRSATFGLSVVVKLGTYSSTSTRNRRTAAY